MNAASVKRLIETHVAVTATIVWGFIVASNPQYKVIFLTITAAIVICLIQASKLQ